jgi:hypothetical protein
LCFFVLPTFYERFCANILAPKKFKHKMSVQKKLCAQAASQMYVKLSLDHPMIE